MLLFDAHLDLSMNALEWNRDLTRPLGEIRAREHGQTDKPDRTRGTVCLPEMRRGGVGLCVATLIARAVEPGNPLPGWHSPQIAWAQTQGQLAWYRAMEEAGQLTPIRDRQELAASINAWSSDSPADRGEKTGLAPSERPAIVGENRDREVPVPVFSPPSTAPIGYVLSLEGADSLITPKYLERAYSAGLRALGPAHYGAGRYSPGTHATGGLTALGRELLGEMKRMGMILDVTHLSDEAFWEALNLFDGPVWASHNNCRALVPDQRQFTDEQLSVLIERGAVIGAVLDAWMLVPGWVRGKTTPEETGVSLAHVVDHIDHVCQLAGNARHAGIGSDLDGGYGREQTPIDVATIADLAGIPAILDRRGYSSPDIQRIMSGNWISFLEHAWK